MSTDTTQPEGPSESDAVLDALLQQTHAALGEAVAERLAQAGGPIPLVDADTALDLLLRETHNAVGEAIAAASETQRTPATAGPGTVHDERTHGFTADGPAQATAVLPGPQGLPVLLDAGPPYTAEADLPSRPPSDGSQGPAGTAGTLPYTWVPRLTAGLKLHGEYQGSGFTEPKYIARRGDGQVVQLSRLLHLVAGAIDGIRDTERIAHRVSGLFGREVSEENISYLVEQKLIPLGVTVPRDQPDDQGSPDATSTRSDLLVALKRHKVLFSERSTNRIGRALAWLHHPLAAVPVLGAMLGFDVWLFGVHGAVPTLLQTLDQPISLLAVFALTLTSMLFHEFGHASAASYGKARPGCIGAGLFLIWPSVYTDVTDVYRLGRLGRLRTDFGGTYFNIVFMVCLGACYALTGQPLFLATVLLIHMELLEQLTPAIRLDGYYILGDMAGVPDLFGKISPILLSFVPGRAPSPTVAGLKRSARVTVAAWILAMVILQGSFSGYIAWNLPRIVSTASHSLVAQLTGTASTFTHGHIGDGMLGILGSLMLILSIFGLAYLSLVLVGRLLRSAVRGSQGRPQLRATAGAAMLIVAVSVAIVLTSASTPQPLPELPPLVPVLQPGVPTTEPAGPTESQPHSSPSSTEPSVVHPTHSAELRRLTRHLEVQSTIVSP